MVYVLLALLIIAIGFCIYLKKWYDKKIIIQTAILKDQFKFTAKKEEEEYYYKIGQLKEQLLKEQEIYRERADQLKQQSLESYENFKKEIEEKRQLQLQLLNSEKENVLQEVDSFKKLELQKANITITKEIEEKERIANGQLDQFLMSIKEYTNQKEIEKKRLDEELSELTKKRNATIEAWKREEERRLNQDFYRIQLSSQDREDILLLEGIRPKLNNKDAVNKLIYESLIKKPMNEMLLRVVGEETYSGIYKITHIDSQKSYIGKSVDVKKRLADHVKGAFQISTISDQVIHHKMDELGIENFTFEILEKVPKDKLTEREKYYITQYQSQSWGYNQVL